jgi:hypothetical protein
MPEADLAARGYVAEEFFLAGTATSYLPAPGATLGEDGRWDAVEDGVAEFRTRILVVRPADPARCNATAVVHWLNVTAATRRAPPTTTSSSQALCGSACRRSRWASTAARPARRPPRGAAFRATHSRRGTRSVTGRSCTL